VSAAATRWPWRLATAADLPALAQLYAQCARQLGSLVYSPEQVVAWQSFAQDAPGFADYVLGATTWLTDDELGPLGFCGVDAQGEVRSLYVRVSAVRQGLGTALLQQALHGARQQGLSSFVAWATPFSLAVFYRAGFALLRTVREPFQGVMFERYRVMSG